MQIEHMLNGRMSISYVFLINFVFHIRSIFISTLLRRDALRLLYLYTSEILLRIFLPAPQQN